MVKTKFEFDIVVYGATGFTGKLVVEYLSSVIQQTPTIRLAIAGRNREKLMAVKGMYYLPENIPVVVADHDDLLALRNIVSSTKVVISCVGPFSLHGTNIVRVCAECGTDYVDISGESHWIRDMLNAYDELAKSTGSRIVFSCGFDSIPSDLGVYYLQKKARYYFGSPIARVKGRVKSLYGTLLSRGTVETHEALMAKSKHDLSLYQFMFDPFGLTPGFSGPAQPIVNTPVFDTDLNSWAAPFLAGPINTKTVYRSNLLQDFLYGKDFIYDEMISTGSGEEGKSNIEKVLTEIGGFGATNQKELFEFGEGPSKQQRQAGSYTMLYHGILDDKEAICVAISDKLDPGYGSTAKLVSESALCLLEDQIKVAGGIWTPASAMGDKLVNRLANKGVISISHELFSVE